MRGPYRWKTGFKTQVYNVESYAKIINQLRPAPKVAPNGKLVLNFDYKPKTITLSPTYTKDKIILKDNVIQLPGHIKGPIIFFLFCEWNEGRAVFVLTVDIES